MPRSISYSEIDAFSACRQRWHWSYQRRIEPRHSNRTPTLGSCGHEALASIHRGEDPETGIARWLKNEFETRELFDEEKEMYSGVADEVRQIIPRYLEHYAAEPLEAIAVEHKFTARIPKTQIDLEGFFDALVRAPSGAVWLMESKFPKQQFRDLDSIELDAQLGIYGFAALKSGFPIVGVIYNQILGKAPSKPTLNKNGTMSRADIRCDWPTYEMALLENGLHPNDYQDMRDKLSKKEFFRRDYIPMSKATLDVFIEDVRRRARAARRKSIDVYRSENKVNCRICPFVELCIGQVHGENVEQRIEISFAPRRSRRNEPTIAAQMEEDFVVLT